MWSILACLGRNVWLTCATGETKDRVVHPFRHLIAQRHVAVLICAATLFLKLLIPAGYMIDSDHGQVTMTICSGIAPAPAMMDMPGMHRDIAGHGKSKNHGAAEMPCAFSGLSAATTGAIDPIQLGALIAFIPAFGAARTALPAPWHPAHLRPPSRAPPAHL